MLTAVAVYVVLADGRPPPGDATIERGPLAPTLVTPPPDREPPRRVAAVEPRVKDVPEAGGAARAAVPRASLATPAVRLAAGGGSDRGRDDRGEGGAGERDDGGEGPSPAPIAQLPTPTPAPPRDDDADAGGEDPPGVGEDPVAEGDPVADGGAADDPQRTAWAPEAGADDTGR